MLARDDSRDRAKEYGSATDSTKEPQTQTYIETEDSGLFVVTPVRAKLRQEGLPGHPLSRVICDQCGEGVNDKREAVVDDRTLCKPCANGAYYMAAELSVAPSCNQTNDLNNSHDKATVATKLVVAVIGFSNSGKTRVVAALVKSLTARGLKIAAIKHCPHGHELPPTNSDSDRLYGALAVVAITSSPDQRTTIEKVVQDSSLAPLATLVQI